MPVAAGVLAPDAPHSGARSPSWRARWCCTGSPSRRAVAVGLHRSHAAFGGQGARLASTSGWRVCHIARYSLASATASVLPEAFGSSSKTPCGWSSTTRHPNRSRWWATATASARASRRMRTCQWPLPLVTRSSAIASLPSSSESPYGSSSRPDPLSPIPRPQEPLARPRARPEDRALRPPGRCRDRTSYHRERGGFERQSMSHGCS